MADGADPTASRRDRGKALSFIIVVLLMIGEGVAVFVLTNAMNSGPSSAVAADDYDAGATEAGAGVAGQTDLVEIELAECRPSNKMSGKFISFQIRISILVRAAEQERAEQLVESKRARLRDRTNFVIRSAELKHLNDPALQTIRRRLEHEYDRVFDDDELVQEVLIPEWLQSNPGV